MIEYLNVLEPMTMHDTVLVCGYSDSMKFHDGWYTTFAGIGAANEIPFFNVRNRNHHLAYNNQDTRDQVPYGMKIYQLGVSFWAPQVATQMLLVDTTPTYAEEIHSAVWEADLPQHAGLILRVNQDDRLKHQVAMAPSGMGPYGGGMGHGDPTEPKSDEPSTPAFMKGCTTNGMPRLQCRWPFPVPIDVPIRATVSVVIKFSEWARQLLQSMTGPHYYLMGPNQLHVYACFGITVTLSVIRYVQQRGSYHRGGK